MNIPEPDSADPPPDLRSRMLARASRAGQASAGGSSVLPSALAAVLLFGAGLGALLLPAGRRESDRSQEFVRQTEAGVERVIAWLERSAGRRGT